MGRRPALALAQAVTLAALARPAGAEPLDLELPTARRIARAGATLVSDDGVGALHGNPASLARSGARRVELDVVVHDADASFRARGATDAPTIEDRAGAGVLPAGFAALPVGPAVLAIGYLRSADVDTALPAPRGEDPDDIARLYPHRYAGTAARLAQHTLLVGGATRLGEAVALGAALHLARVELGEHRTVWAGRRPRDPDGDPRRDLELDVAASDPLVLGGALGALYAPPTLPLELAAGLRYRHRVAAAGDAALVAEHGGATPAPIEDAPRARVALEPALAVALGARYLGERVTVELVGEHTRPLDDDRPRWALDGVAVRDDDDTVAPLEAVPAFAVERARWGARGAVDVEAVEGLLWLTCGYAYGSPARAAEGDAPHALGLARHTLALGAEASWDDVTVAIGYARSLAAAVDRDATTAVIEPFATGDATTTGAGRYDEATDVVGLGARVGF